MIPIRKAPTAIQILRKEGFRGLGRCIASYYAPNKQQDPTSNRKHLEPHLQMLKQREDLVVAEIGVWKGENAERICELLDVRKIYLIDPYDEYEEYNEGKSDISRLTNAESEAHNRLKGYSYIEWIKDYSTKAVEKIDDELDYIYIDGNHAYKFVKSDIVNYYELLSEDGILAGDDIHFSGVAQAVSEFAVENNIQPHFEKISPDWYFINNHNMNPSFEYKHTPEDVDSTIR